MPFLRELARGRRGIGIGRPAHSLSAQAETEDEYYRRERPAGACAVLVSVEAPVASGLPVLDYSVTCSLGPERALIAEEEGPEPWRPGPSSSSFPLLLPLLAAALRRRAGEA
jgi:hypothetical protein